MFFPSFPFVGVMLFPSLVVGNASVEGGTFLVSLSLFFPLVSLSLLSSHSPSFSVSLPLFPFPSSSLFHLLFLSFRLSLPFFPSSFLSLEGFFFFEGTACTVYLRDVRNETTDCNQLYLYWNKERYFFS